MKSIPVKGGFYEKRAKCKSSDPTAEKNTLSEEVN